MRSGPKILLIVGLVMTAVSARASAPDLPRADGDKIVRNGYNEFYGPAYSKTEMESIKVLGVHLGMRWSDAERIILSQGFTRNSEYGFMMSRGSGQRDFISFTVKRLNGVRKRLTAVNYSRYADLKTAESRAAVRNDLVSVFGKPTVWYSPEVGKDLVESMQWLTRDSIVDKGQRYQAKVCGFSWECDYILYKEDCRPHVKDAHGVALEISVLHNVSEVDYQLYDMDIELTEVRSSQRFWAMDVGNTICAIPRIH